jgi:hypothetical protein
MQNICLQYFLFSTLLAWMRRAVDPERFILYPDPPFKAFLDLDLDLDPTFILNTNLSHVKLARPKTLLRNMFSYSEHLHLSPQRVFFLQSYVKK